jgi:hypothetical protein
MAFRSKSYSKSEFEIHHEEPKKSLSYDHKAKFKMQHNNRLGLVLSTGRGTVFSSVSWLKSQTASSAFAVDLEALHSYNSYVKYEEQSAPTKHRFNVFKKRIQESALKTNDASSSERISGKHYSEKVSDKPTSIQNSIKGQLKPVIKNLEARFEALNSLIDPQFNQEPSSSKQTTHKRSLTSPNQSISKLFQPLKQPDRIVGPGPRIKDQLKRLFHNPIIRTFRRGEDSPSQQEEDDKRRTDLDIKIKEPKPQTSRIFRPIRQLRTDIMLEKKPSLDVKSVAKSPKTVAVQQVGSKDPKPDGTKEKVHAMFHRECFHTVRKFRRIVDSKQYGLTEPLAEMLQAHLINRKQINQLKCSWSLIFCWYRVLDAILKKKIKHRVVELFKNFKNIKFEIVIKKAKEVARKKLIVKQARDQIIAAKSMPLLGILLQKPAENLAKRFVCFMLIKSMFPMQLKYRFLRLKHYARKLRFATKNLLRTKRNVMSHVSKVWDDAMRSNFGGGNEQPQLSKLMQSFKEPICQFFLDYYECARTTDTMYALAEARNTKSKYSRGMNSSTRWFNSHEFDANKLMRSLTRNSQAERRYVFDLVQEHLEQHIERSIAVEEPGSAVKRARLRSIGSTVSMLASSHSSKVLSLSKKSGNKVIRSLGKKQLSLQQSANESIKEWEAGYGSKYCALANSGRLPLIQPDPIVTCKPFKPLDVFNHLDSKYMNSLFSVLQERESKIRSTWGR